MDSNTEKTIGHKKRVVEPTVSLQQHNKRKSAPTLDENVEGVAKLRRATMKDTEIEYGGYEEERQEQVQLDSNQESVPQTDTPGDDNSEELLQVSASDHLPVPQLRLDENGRIVLDEQSLEVTVPKPVPTYEDHEVVYETPHAVNSWTFAGRKPGERWSASDTAKFYTALRQYGAEFSLIANLFPNRTRKQVWSKFKKEERENKPRVDWALANRLPIGNALPNELSQ